MLSYRLLKFVAAIFIIFIINCGGGGGSNSVSDNIGDDVIDTSNKSVIQVLEDLGANLDVAPRTDPNGIAFNAETNHPLGKVVTTLFKINEIYAAGNPLGNQKQVFYDDKIADFATLDYSENDEDWTKYPKKAIAADLDGDGMDEIVIVVVFPETNKISLKVIDWKDDIKSTVVRRIDPHLGRKPLSEVFDFIKNNPTYRGLARDIDAGDIDGDGKVEIVVAVGPVIYLLDDQENNYDILQYKEYPAIGTKQQYVRIAVGDIDSDLKDEIVVINGDWDDSIYAEYYIYDDLEEYNNLDSALISGDGPLRVLTNIDGIDYGINSGDCVVSDIDGPNDEHGDKLMEIVISGNKTKNGLWPDNTIETLVLDIKFDEDTNIIFEFMPTYFDDFDNHYLGDMQYLAVPGLATGDIDGDGINEIVAFDEILKIEHESRGLETPWGGEVLIYGKSRGADINQDALVVGDVTGDLPIEGEELSNKDEIVYYDREDETIRIWGFNSDTNTIEVIAEKWKTEDPYYMTLCLPNIDDDSYTVEYRGHALLFTNPRIIAVICSPPYYDGIEQNKGSTSYGTVKGESSADQHSLGFELAAMIGFKGEIKVPIVGLGFDGTVKAFFKRKLKWKWGNSLAIKESFGYTCPEGKDVVVWTTIPLDMYIYNTISSPNRDEVGSEVCLKIPRAPTQYHSDVLFYNKYINAEIDTIIKPEILHHTLGDPWSYHSWEESRILKQDNDNLWLQGLYSKYYMTIGAVEDGTTEISLTELESEISAFTNTGKVRVQIETTSAGVIKGGYFEGFKGYEHSVKNSSGTYIKGKVGDIRPDNWDSSLQFAYGIMAYPVKIEDTNTGDVQQFTMVTYWVDDPKYIP